MTNDQFSTISRKLDALNETVSGHTKLLDKLCTGVVILQEDMKGVKATLHELDDKVNIIQNQIDGIIGKLIRLDQEWAMTVKATRDHSARLDTIEKRVERLELSYAR